MTTDTIGGVWTYAMELAKALRPRGVRIGLATMGRALSEDQRRDIATLPHITLFESDYKLEWMQDPWNDVRAAGDWLVQIAQRYQPDLIHLNGYAHGSLPWNAPVIVVGHSCVLSWWQAVKGHAAPADWDHYKDVIRDGIAAADLVIAPSQAMMECLEEHYGPIERRRVIYNAVDPSRLWATWKEPTILAAGRLWDEAKNIVQLTKIAPCIGWRIEIAGDRGKFGEFERPQPNVDFLGQLDQEQLADRMARAMIYVLPARYEPFGLSILEAAISGCALIIGDIPSLREVWDDAAVYVQPDDEDALLRAIKRYMVDHNFRQEMASRAMRRAKRYSPEAMACNYLASYQDVLESKPAGRTQEEAICGS